MNAERFNWKEIAQLVWRHRHYCADSGWVVVSRYARLRRKLARYDAVRGHLRRHRRRNDDQVREAAPLVEDGLTCPKRVVRPGCSSDVAHARRLFFALRRGLTPAIRPHRRTRCPL